MKLKVKVDLFFIRKLALKLKICPSFTNMYLNSSLNVKYMSLWYCRMILLFFLFVFFASGFTSLQKYTIKFVYNELNVN